MTTATTIKAANLSRFHLGLTVRVKEGQSEFIDVLRGVSHEADLIEDREMFEEVPTYSLGRASTTLKFLRAGDIQINGNATVEVMP